jgi:hypothetical protein
MRFDIDGILAKCFSCGGSEFAPLRASPGRPVDTLACTHCCSEIMYDDLLSQIARTAITARSASSAGDQLTRLYGAWKAPRA